VREATRLIVVSDIHYSWGRVFEISIFASAGDNVNDFWGGWMTTSEIVGSCHLSLLRSLFAFGCFFFIRSIANSSVAIIKSGKKKSCWNSGITGLTEILEAGEMAISPAPSVTKRYSV